jgi:predicted MFS family arabinose efflux permease
VLFLQNGVRVTATAAGGVLVVAGMWSPLLSRLTGRIADHKGARRLISSGLIAAAIGLLGVALAAPAKDVLVILPGLLVFGISRPFVFTPASTGPIKALPSSERGLASSLVAESRQIGAVLGVAALGSITAAFELHSTAGASAAGFQAAMLTAAVTSLAAGLLVLVAEPKGA